MQLALIWPLSGRGITSKGEKETFWDEEAVRWQRSSSSRNQPEITGARNALTVWDVNLEMLFLLFYPLHISDVLLHHCMPVPSGFRVSYRLQHQIQVGGAEMWSLLSSC